MKKVKRITIAIGALILLILVSSSISYNSVNHSILLLQLGEIKSIKDDPGLFFKIPIIQTKKDIYVGERLYPISQSEVITSDKKTMIADCYSTWKVEDPKLYYQTLSSESIAESRINTSVYNAMKNVISSTTQSDVITGKDGSLNEAILANISGLENYGIKVTKIEMKAIDLPSDNKEAVYNRMISERQVIAAEYKANGEKEASNIKSQTDANVRTIVSEAQVVAANTEAEGETIYFQTLAEAYSASPERTDFYNFIIGLDTMKESLSNGATITIDENSPLYNILNNK